MNAMALTTHAALVSVMSAVFPGDGKKGGSGPPRPDPNRKDLAAGHGDVESAVAAINAAFRF